MPRYKLTIEYDGTSFSGWQIQPDARTAEEEIEKAMSQILQAPIDIIGQGEPMQEFMQKDRSLMWIYRIL